MKHNTYNALCIDVYDADSATFVVDCGFYIKHEIKTRFMKIDTPELRTRNNKEKELAIEARDYVRKMILDKEVMIKTYLNRREENKKGKFGRYLVDVFLDTGAYLNSMLITKGYAVYYDGGKREKWFAGE